jgi:lactoylglutathione lyase
LCSIFPIQTRLKISKIKDVEGELAKAVKVGAATVVREPKTKPWGQAVGYVRDLNGVIVEIGSPVE